MFLLTDFISPNSFFKVPRAAAERNFESSVRKSFSLLIRSSLESSDNSLLLIFFIELISPPAVPSHRSSRIVFLRLMSRNPQSHSQLFPLPVLIPHFFRWSVIQVLLLVSILFQVVLRP